MPTKIITVHAAASVPVESSGVDINKGAPLNSVEFDQNLVNLRAAIDRGTFATKVTTPALRLGSTDVTASAAELNKLAGTPAGLTSTEIGYLDGVTSPIQGQLNGKAPIDNPTLTGSAVIDAVKIGRGGSGAASADNVAVGSGVFPGLIGTGHRNVGFGANIGTLNTGGSDNVMVGNNIATNIDLPQSNVLIGSGCAIGVYTNLTAAVAIGPAAGNSVLGNYSVAIGYNTQTELDSVAIGANAYAGAGGIAIGNSAAAPANEAAIGSTNITRTTIHGVLRKNALDTAPASATATGTLGEIRITATHIYVCSATNIWVRTALATW